MKCDSLRWLIVLCIGLVPQIAKAKPDLGKIWFAESIVLRLAEVAPILSDPGSDLDKKFFISNDAKKTDEPRKDSVRWCECVLVRKLEKVVLPDALQKESLSWGALEWADSKAGLSGVVGLAASSIFVVGDDELQNQFWIFELYGSKGELGYIGVAHDCGFGMFQYHPNTRFALLANAALASKLAQIANEDGSSRTKLKK